MKKALLFALVTLPLAACTQPPPDRFKYYDVNFKEIKNPSDEFIKSAISSHISHNWLVPPNMPVEGLSLDVVVDLNRRGDIADIRISRSSGNARFDNSLIRAVRRSIPLPIPANKLEKFRYLELTFERPK